MWTQFTFPASGKLIYQTELIPYSFDLDGNIHRNIYFYKSSFKQNLQSFYMLIMEYNAMTVLLMKNQHWFSITKKP